MEILSWNVNGIRAVHKKGFLDWVKKRSPDILCIQEIRASKEQFPKELLEVENYQLYINPAKKKGYSGTAVYTKEEPNEIKKEIGIERFDKEGRALILKYPKFTLFNFYIPNGKRDKSDMDYKLKSYDKIFEHIKNAKEKNIILTGDFNIAHEEIDLKRSDDNKGNTMFTPEEREKIDNLLDIGFKDTFRTLNKDTEKYSWWPYWRNSRERNIGWRIDYVFASNNLSKKIKKAFILNQVMGSDHCPVGIEMLK